MAAISCPPSSSIAAFLGRSGRSPPSVTLNGSRRLRYRLAAASRLYSSNPNGSLSNPNGSDELQGALHPPLPPPRSGKGAPVFVAVPADSVGPAGSVERRKAMAASFAALAAAGVEGVSVELWWGVVEREAPGAYDWGGYVDLVSLARQHGLKVRAVMAFHQYGPGPGDPCWIPLPWWVLEEMDREPDLAYTDRFGKRSRECVSLGCDILPVLRGRSPLQVYSDFMRSFRITFKDFLGVVITEIQVGMGPAGELRYPSFPSEKLNRPSSARGLGEFQCYDKYMLASLNACARDVGMREWENGGLLGASNLLQNPEETSFFINDGSWNSAYGRFFLEWYSGMLLIHGERLSMMADSIFWHSGVKISAKVGGVYWHYYTSSHPSELTAGYYNTLVRDGYLPIAQMFSRYRMIMCCNCFDMQDTEEQDKKSSPEGYLKQLVYAARMFNLPISGENSVTRLDDTSLKQIIKTSRLYCNGAREPSLSFNYVRMNRNLFDSRNWTRFTRFVKQMSDYRTFQAKLDFKIESCLSSISAPEVVGRAFAYN